ncbi:MAG: phosphoribosylformylglycinamidine cyclo-ligase [Clostridia bacterium]|jgi:phosphoribosylformylglycinamidine cyclo-ligase|nr:phosphoribosylformylglycinamidine cyclo-ligase [Clostridia bacterium]
MLLKEGSDMEKMSNEKVTYKSAGVDVEAGYQAVSLMKQHTQRTLIPGVIGGLGSFGGFFEIDTEKYKKPVLVSGTDGVGTKLQIAFMTGIHDTIGIDCVAMCVNDIACHGAKPLYFLDYIGTGMLNPQAAAEVVKGICDGCIEAGCALIGGETAEMPGFYKKGEYDLAGFAVGVVDKDKVINGAEIKEGDVIIGLASSGIHSNGYSLVRKLFFDINNYSIDEYVSELGCTLGQELLKPTRIYVKTILELAERYDIKGIAHITGGGFIENIPRTIPVGLKAEISLGSFPVLPVFKLMQKLGNMEDKEMYNTFNMGIGLVLVVNENEVEQVMLSLSEMKEAAYIIGKVTKGEGGIALCQS